MGIRLETHRFLGDNGKRDKLLLQIGVAPAYAQDVDMEELSHSFESTMSRKETKHRAKVIARIAVLSP